MNTQHKVGCADLGCPGCYATNPRPNPPQHAMFMQSTGDGVCFAHGPYKNADKSANCPQWPACITDPQKPEFWRMAYRAGDPPSVTEPDFCPDCGSWNKKKFRLPCIRFVGDESREFVHPWHNAAQPEPREEQNVAGHTAVLRANDSFGDSDGGRGGSSKLAIANTPRPDPSASDFYKQSWCSTHGDEIFGGEDAITFADAFAKWLAARRLFPDRKLVEALRNLIAAIYADFRCLCDPDVDVEGRIVLHAPNCPVQLAEAALKTQEPAPEEK